MIVVLRNFFTFMVFGSIVQMLDDDPTVAIFGLVITGITFYVYGLYDG